MADVASSGGGDGSVAATVAPIAEGCLPSSTMETDEAVVGSSSVSDEKNMTALDDGEVVNDKDSIHEILEGMTNEFNKAVSPIRHSTDDDERTVTEDETTLSASPSSKMIDEASKDESECEDAVEQVVTIQNDVTSPPQAASEENRKDEDDTNVGQTVDKQQEIVKKDNGIPRIVLTFRTIDENTDHGKKTKISSCSSNLTLVPDELMANCDQISGVSVKIENSDETSDVMEESQAEESQTEKADSNGTKESISPKEAEITDEDKTDSVEKKKADGMEKKLDKDAPSTQPSLQKKSENVESNVEDGNTETTLAENVQQESTAPVTRKRRIGRPRLRALRFLVFLIYHLLGCI